MKITALIENTSNDINLSAEHGLSLWIEYSGACILFDTGASVAFAGNAEKLGVDLSSADFAVLSHGHYDHAGGLKEFMRINSKALVYMKREAAGEYYAGIRGIAQRYVGVDPAVFSEYGGRIHFIESGFEPAQGCHILTEIEATTGFQCKNRFLLVKRDGKVLKDDFMHELMLVFEEEDGIVAVTGCSHNGVVNLVQTAKNRFPEKKLKAVIGGFHLMGATPDGMGCSKRFLGLLAGKLSGCGKIYTCHCTGNKAYNILKEYLGDSLNQINTGMSVDV